MIRFVTNYFQRTVGYSAERFILEMLLLKIIGLIVLYLVIEISINFNINLIEGYEYDRYIIENYNWFFSLLIYCVLIPIFETFLTQFLPIKLISIWTKNKIILLIGSAVFFTMLHGYPSVILIYTFFSGVIYAWSFIVFWNKGCIAAVLVTSLIHGLYNFIPLMISFL